jgi:hypothetical protein
MGASRKGPSGWYVQAPLVEYRLLYDDSQDEAWLDKVEDHQVVVTWETMRLSGTLPQAYMRA